MAELIIGDVRPRNQYVADAIQTTFPYDFPIMDAADLQVVFDDGDAATSFSVTDVGLSAGGDIVFDAAPATGIRITIYRDMPFARETDFQESGDFRASVINEELDRMAMLLQQAETIVGDGLHKQPYDADDPLILPTASDRANKFLGFDETGLPKVLASQFDSTVAAEASATAAAASAALAQTEADFALNTAVPVDVFSGDGVLTAFTLSRTVNNATSIIVTVDGVKQHTGTYTAAVTTLTFTAAPPSGTNNIEVVYIGFMGLISDVAEIGDDALSGDMISGGVLDAVSVDGLNGGPLAGFRNAIINGGFDIWQRGVNFSTFNISVADRWFVGTSSGPSSITISRQSFTPGQTDVPGEPTYYLRIDQADNNTLTLQRVEDVRSFAGQEVTYSFWAKADAATTMTVFMSQYFGPSGSTTVSVATPSFSLTTSWQKFTHTVTLPSISGKTINAGSYLQFNHSITGNYVTDMARVQLEPGSVATPFEHRPIATEMALCQRYYVELNKASAAWAVTATDIAVSHEWPVEMRVAPTVALLDTTFVFNDYNTNSTSSSPGFTTQSITTKGAQTRSSGFTGLTTDRPGYINQTTSVWSADAEL
jgi:hypothetical protein